MNNKMSSFVISCRTLERLPRRLPFHLTTSRDKNIKETSNKVVKYALLAMLECSHSEDMTPHANYGGAHLFLPSVIGSLMLTRCDASLFTVAKVKNVPTEVRCRKWELPIYVLRE